MDGEGRWYSNAASLVLFLLGESAPLRTATHQILRQNQATVLADGFALVEVFYEIEASAFRTYVNFGWVCAWGRGAHGSCLGLREACAFPLAGLVSDGALEESKLGKRERRVRFQI